MHIALLTDSEGRGGAAISAGRLASALTASGHKVSRIVGYPGAGNYPWKTEVLTPPASFVWRATRKILPTRQNESRLISHLQKELHAILSRLKPDVINVHNLHSAYPSGWRSGLVEVCLEHAPTVWTLHDMWSFTGRCAYSYECRKFLSGCDETCPTPHEYPALEPHRIREAWEQRTLLLGKHPELVAVTPSGWLAEEAQRGFWKQHRVEVIPYGLPIDVFEPQNRTAARQKLGIGTADPVLLMVGADLSERRKGGSILMGALETLSTPITFITLGRSEGSFSSAKIKTCPLGYIDSDYERVLVYNAACFLVHPSLADNAPNVVLESIACGTPVVAFRTGGVPEIVRPGVTGFLADEISSGALAAVLGNALNYTGDLRVSCRTVAETEYSDSLQAERYVKLFSELRASKKLA